MSQSRSHCPLHRRRPQRQKEASMIRQRPRGFRGHAAVTARAALAAHLQQVLDWHAQWLLHRLARCRQRGRGRRQGAGGHSSQAGGVVHGHAPIVLEPGAALQQLHLEAMLQGAGGAYKAGGEARTSKKAASRCHHWSNSRTALPHEAAHLGGLMQSERTPARRTPARQAGHSRQAAAERPAWPAWSGHRRPSKQRGHQSKLPAACRHQSSTRQPGTCLQKVQLLCMPILIIQDPVQAAGRARRSTADAECC